MGPAAAEGLSISDQATEAAVQGLPGDWRWQEGQPPLPRGRAEPNPATLYLPAKVDQALLMGKAWLQSGAFQTARNLFRHAQALDPACALAHCLEGVALSQQGQLVRAFRALDRALA